jgi:hypothetical protein
MQANLADGPIIPQTFPETLAQEAVAHLCIFRYGAVEFRLCARK